MWSQTSVANFVISMKKIVAEQTDNFVVKMSISKILAMKK